MPELPEVEVTRRALARALVGERVARVWVSGSKLRVSLDPSSCEWLQGRVIDSVRRSGKTILVDVGGRVMVAHLGMSGCFRVGGAERKHDHVRFELESGCHVVYNDPRRFGFIQLHEVRDEKPVGRSITSMTAGLDCLDSNLSGKLLQKGLCWRGRQELKLALLDQQFLAGLGNIYASEVLHRAGLLPTRCAASVTIEEAEVLVHCIREVLLEAIEAGGSSISDHRLLDGSSGSYQLQHRVYGREGCSCRKCPGLVVRTLQSGRSSFFCPLCQK